MNGRRDLEGLSALVTGATSGIGKAAAEELGRHGAEIVVHGRDAARGSGSIISLASMAGQIGLVGGTAYGATKATLASMTRSWAADLRDAGRHPGGPAFHPHADPEGS
jgi:NAD(P)-dependent dehydrogenase (short-subunit alcohol dehydrogenase family)